ncbi:MAG: DUF3347 domain-containing protein [Agriterribacter sp.]
MKHIIIAGAVVTATLLAACNNNKSEHNHGDHTTDATAHVAPVEDAEIKTTAVTFTNVDATAATIIKEVVDHYLHIKNALTNGDAGEAASGGKAMATAIRKLDKSLLTAEQKKIFDENQNELTGNAEHIGENAGNIKHQREHFAVMSEEVYALAKAFGGGRPLYQAHCPMYNDNKGGMWLSEAKEVKNPYFGASMLTCGEIQEIIQ